jgi:hypothetical protein
MADPFTEKMLACCQAGYFDMLKRYHVTGKRETWELTLLEPLKTYPDFKGRFVTGRACSDETEEEPQTMRRRFALFWLAADPELAPRPTDLFADGTKCRVQGEILIDLQSYYCYILAMTIRLHEITGNK